MRLRVAKAPKAFTRACHFPTVPVGATHNVMMAAALDKAKRSSRRRARAGDGDVAECLPRGRQDRGHRYGTRTARALPLKARFHRTAGSSETDERSPCRRRGYVDSVARARLLETAFAAREDGLSAEKERAARRRHAERSSPSLVTRSVSRLSPDLQAQ